MTDKERIKQLESMVEAVAEARDRAEDACADAAKELVLAYFNWDEERAKLWWKTANPMFGEIIPNDLLKIGRSPKVLAVVIELTCGNVSHYSMKDTA